MDQNKFWQLIDQARAEGGGWEEMHSPLVDKLMALPVEEILVWSHIFSLYQKLSYKSKLWQAAYLINGGCSDDGFDYFRGWLTAQGKEVFLNALQEPDLLAEVESCEEDVEFEDMLATATTAYLRKIGAERDYARFYQELKKVELPKEMILAITEEVNYAPDIEDAWDEDNNEEMKKRFPGLWDRFGY